MPDERRPFSLTWLAFAASIIVLAGSLWLSMGMNLKACPLCFYQRTFAMGIVAVFTIGLVSRAAPRAILSMLSLPMGIAALTVAGFHVSLELNGTLECPRGVLGVGTAPQQSLAGLAIMTILLAADVIRNRSALRFAAGAFIASIVVGVVLGWLAIASSPPLPGPPAAPYEGEPEVCRRPFDAG